MYDEGLGYHYNYEGGLFMASNVDNSTCVWNCQIKAGHGVHFCAHFMPEFSPSFAIYCHCPPESVIYIEKCLISSCIRIDRHQPDMDYQYNTTTANERKRQCVIIHNMISVFFWPLSLKRNMFYVPKGHKLMTLNKIKTNTK